MLGSSGLPVVRRSMTGLGKSWNATVPGAIGCYTKGWQSAHREAKPKPHRMIIEQMARLYTRRKGKLLRLCLYGL